MEETTDSTGECTEPEKSQQEIVTGYERIINELRNKLKENENMIKSLSEKYEATESVTDQIDAQKRKYEEIVCAKERTIDSLLAQVNEKGKENESLADSFEQCKSNYLKATTQAENLQNSYDELRKKYEFSVEEKIKISNDLKNIRQTFLGPDEELRGLNDKENETLKRCIEFINTNSSLRANALTTQKAIRKKIASITSYMDRREKLYRSCK